MRAEGYAEGTKEKHDGDSVFAEADLLERISLILKHRSPRAASQPPMGEENR
jgi:hypothetical protein